MPEQDGFVVTLAAGLRAGDDLAQFAMDGRFADEAGIDMRPERAELAGPELAEIVDDDLVDDRGHGELERAHRAIGDHAGAFADPGRLEDLLTRFEARSLDHDVGAVETALPILSHDDLLAEIALERPGEGLAAFLAA